MSYAGPDYKGNPGVIPLRNVDANAARDAAGRKAVQDVAPGSEFDNNIPEELQACLDRLDEVRTEMGNLYAQMYAASSGMGISWTIGVYKPPAKQKESIRMEISKLEDEERELQARVYELYYVFPAMDSDNDMEEDMRDIEDATQPGEYNVKGGAKGTSKKTVKPDQGR